MWKIWEKQPFFRADLAGLGKYHTGGYGRIGVYRDKQNIVFHKASWEKISVKSPSRVKDEPSDVLFGHAGQLVREDVLQPDQPDEGLSRGASGDGVRDDVKLNHPPPLLCTGRLVTSNVRVEQVDLGQKRGVITRDLIS